MLRIRRDDEGNLLIAIAVIMVVVLLGTTLMARAVANINNVKHRENFASALGDADAGISDALFRLDQGASASFCVGATGCVASSVPAAPGVEYKATKQSPNQWLVQSVGTEHGMGHAAQVVVTRTARFPFALFGNTAVTVNGNSSGVQQTVFNTYNSATPTQSPTDGPVSIGSNGTVSCNGGISNNVTVVYYSGGGGVAGCSGAAGITPDPSIYYLANPSPPPGAQACPDGGLLGSGYGYPVLAPGTYSCTAPVQMSGNLTISPVGEVDLYIVSPSSTDTTDVLDIAPSSCINGPTNGAGGLCPASPTNYPIASNLQIFANGAGAIGNENGQGYTIGGVIYAPNASLTADGCKSTYYGSVVANIVTCNGGPNLSVNYDNSLGNQMGPWSAGQYTEVGSNTFTIP